jgi:ribosome-binding factor A
MKERAESIIQKLVSEFINRESNRQSLITVTEVKLDPKTRKTLVFISAYPEKDTRAAVEFLNRRRDDVRMYFKKNSKLAGLPRITFLADPIIGGVRTEEV